MHLAPGVAFTPQLQRAGVVITLSALASLKVPDGALSSVMIYKEALQMRPSFLLNSLVKQFINDGYRNMSFTITGLFSADGYAVSK